MAAMEQCGRGVPVRYVRAVSIPEEETCFVFYDALPRQAASETARFANLEVVCIAVSATTEARA